MGCCSLRYRRWRRPATLYWMSYAFYLDDWADVFASDWNGVYLPGFINVDDDPLKGATETDGVLWFLPWLEASSSSAGEIFPANGGGPDGTAISDGQWHTVRYALKLNGATSHETMYVDDVLVRDTDLDFTPGGVPYTLGVAGVVVATYGDVGTPAYILPVDSMLYSAVADPGEPAETGDSDDDPRAEGPSVFIDGINVTDCAIKGSVTRRLNRPGLAEFTLPMDCAIGGAGSIVKIYIDAVLWHHGRVMNCEVDADEDFGYVRYNSSDPMELWSQRPARDDDGDFSKPNFINTFVTGPQIMEEILANSVTYEGTTFLDVDTVAGGGIELLGAPVDWPMSIAEVANLLVSTGQLDCVIEPTDPGGGIMGEVSFYNGNFGTDLQSSVIFEYGTGSHNIRRLRWNEDMTQVCNKLFYYGGPRVGTAQDPEGDQHWCWMVNGTGECFTGVIPPPPNDQSCDMSPADAADMQAKFVTVDACRDESASDVGVRMDIKIWDALGTRCLGPNDVNQEHMLYQWLWLYESYIRCTPREIIHITPIRGYAIGSFDIGDLITVAAGPQVRGGFSGAQRVYEYTVAWEEDGPLELSELQTSPNNEGI